MKFQGGVKEAAKLLAGLSKAAREKVLDIISKKDPQMAKSLHKSMYSFDDLQFLTPMKKFTTVLVARFVFLFQVEHLCPLK